MKKNILALFALLFSCISLSAQFSIEAGPLLKKSDAGKVIKIIGGDKSSFYVLKENGKGKGQKYFIEKYSISNLNMVFSTLLAVPKKAYFAESYLIGDKCFFFYCTEKETTSSLSFCTVDQNGVASEGIELVTINNLSKVKNFLTYPSFYFEIGISPNKKFLSIISNSYEGREQKLKLTLNVYGENIIKTLEKDISETKGKSFIIDDESNVMFISSEEEGKKHLVIIDHSSKVVHKLFLDLKSDKVLEGVTIVKEGENIVVGGFFKEMNGDIYRVGIFCQAFNAVTKEKVKSEEQYLPDELRSDIFHSNEDFISRQFFIENAKIIDNEIYFVAKDVERDNIAILHGVNGAQESFNQWTMGSTLSHYNYYNLESTFSPVSVYTTRKIIIFKVGINGEIGWIKNFSGESEIFNYATRVRSSPSISKTIKTINFIMDNKVLLFHGYTSSSDKGEKSVNIKYSFLERDGNSNTDILCPDDKLCFLYNGKGAFGYFDVYYQYGKNVIVYFNQKENQHFGRIVFN